MNLLEAILTYKCQYKSWKIWERKKINTIRISISKK